MLKFLRKTLVHFRKRPMPSAQPPLQPPPDSAQPPPPPDSQSLKTSLPISKIMLDAASEFHDASVAFMNLSKIFKEQQPEPAISQEKQPAAHHPQPSSHYLKTFKDATSASRNTAASFEMWLKMWKEWRTGESKANEEARVIEQSNRCDETMQKSDGCEVPKSNGDEAAVDQSKAYEAAVDQSKADEATVDSDEADESGEE